MAFIDDFIQTAFNTVFGPEAGKKKPVPDKRVVEILPPLSQVFRSAEGFDVFYELTGQSMNTPADREALMRALAEDPHRYDVALSSRRLEKYIKRKGQFYID